MITLFKDPLFSIWDPSVDHNVMGKTPQVDIQKTEDEYKLLMGIPGLTKEDLVITTLDGVLKISYEKKEETENTIFVNTFTKTYTLPDNIKEGDINGVVKDGVLELKIPIDKKKTRERLISLN